MSEVATLSANWAAARAREIGFDLCGVAPAEDLAVPEHLADWLARGFAGEMRYLHNPRRGDLTSVVPEARSVIVCALNYDQPVPYSIHEAVAIPDPAQNSRADSAAGAPGFVAQVAGRARDAESTPGTISRRNLRLPDPLHSNERDSPRGWISRYAWGDDYHDVLGEKLELLVAALREKFGDQFAARAYVDTGPISERAAAKVAGIGWLGKNTCLINQQIGSWLFLCVIITSLPIADEAADTEGRTAREAKERGIPRRGLLGMTGKEEEEKESKESTSPRKGFRQINFAPDLCGNCTMCLDACPTGALVEPYVMDARRCISYLTIELRGSIPEEFRRDIGWQVFGCDICQDVCPWNRDGGSAARGPERGAGSRANLHAAPDAETDAELDAGLGAKKDGHVAAFAPRARLVAPDLAWLLSLSEADFRETFRGSPVKRTKWRGLIRNACVAAGNALRKQRVAGGAVASDGAFGRAHTSASENVAGGASHSAHKGAEDHTALRARLAELSASDDAVIAEHARWALEQ